MTSGAGSLQHIVAFEMRAAADDGYGNLVSGSFVEQFRRCAAFVYAGGGESVMAARLAGRSLVKVRLHSDAQTQAIKPDWRLRDVVTGSLYALREVDAITSRRWVYLIVESGVAM